MSYTIAKIVLLVVYIHMIAFPKKLYESTSIHELWITWVPLTGLVERIVAHSFWS